MSYTGSSENSEFTKIKDLTPASRRVNTIVKVVSKSEVREVSGGAHRIADALVGDETGSIILTLWDDAIVQIDVNETLRITNGYVRLFRGNMRLNIGRYGRFEKIEETISEVNTENNLSEKSYEQRRPRFRPISSNQDSYRKRRFRR